MRPAAAMALTIALSASAAACDGAQHGDLASKQRAALSVACGIHRVLSELGSLQATSQTGGPPVSAASTLESLESRAARLERDVRDLPQSTRGRAAVLEAAHHGRLTARLLLQRRSGPAAGALGEADQQLAMALAGLTPPGVGDCTWSRLAPRSTG